MGYARGVRFGHAGGHLRDPLIEALYDAGKFGSTKPWWDAFGTPQAARRRVGKLWHCTDTVPGDARQIAVDLLGLDSEWQVGSYAQLARRLLSDLSVSRR